MVSRIGNFMITSVFVPKKAKAYDKINGIVRMLIILAIAVKVTDKAIFPLQICVIKLLVGPPGQVAKISNPTAIIGLKLKIMASVKPMIGKKRSWLVIPIKIALGYFIILVKSARTNVIPIPSIIIASDKGRNTLLKSSVTSIIGF